MLMRWAEQTSESIMLREVPTLADGDRCRMLLRVTHTLTHHNQSSALAHAFYIQDFRSAPV